jgi:hypothetical protein
MLLKQGKCFNGFSCNENGNITIDKIGCGVSHEKDLIWFDLRKGPATFNSSLETYYAEFQTIIGSSSKQKVVFIQYVPRASEVPNLKQPFHIISLICFILTVIAMSMVVLYSLRLY